MALIFTEEQNMLRESARAFLGTEGPVSQLRRLRDTADAAGFWLPLWKQFAEMGFSGVLVPEAQGGMGLGYVEAGIVMEQIGHNLSASPFLASNVVATTAIISAANATQKAYWLPRLASGNAIATLAVDEPVSYTHLTLPTNREV